jgi:hypothetical protein
MYPELKREIKHTPKNLLIKYESGLAQEIRDKYGLFHNDPVVSSTGHTNATDAALFIIYTVWKRLQNDNDNALAKPPPSDPDEKVFIRAAERYRSTLRNFPYE